MLTSIRSLMAASTLAGVLFASAPALADEAAPPSDITITGSAAIVSQYRFRGLAQSDNKPAVQAALTLSHSSGFYISTWGSSASAGTAPINIGGTEIDVYGGYTKALGGVTVDVGIYGYLYPGATAGNLYEFYGSLAKSYGPVTAKAGINFAPAQKVFNYNWSSTARNNTYLYGGLPPTPICSPSSASIAAALSPSSTDYYYFFISDTVHQFSETYEEHQQAISAAQAA